MFETVKLIGTLCVCIIGTFCAVTLLLTTEHKKSSLPFLSVLSYVLFLVLFLFFGAYTFLNIFRGEMLLMQIAVTCCFIVSIVVTYKIKENGKGLALNKITKIPFWCCLAIVITDFIFL